MRRGFLDNPSKLFRITFRKINHTSQRQNPSPPKVGARVRALKPKMQPVRIGFRIKWDVRRCGHPILTQEVLVIRVGTLERDTRDLGQSLNRQLLLFRKTVAVTEPET